VNNLDSKKKHEDLSNVDRELFFASSDEKLRYMLRLLVFSKHTAYVDCQNRFGQTPIMWAAMSGKLKAMKLLLLFGAEPTTRDHSKLEMNDHLRMNGYQSFKKELIPFYENISDRRAKTQEILYAEMRREEKITSILQMIE